MANEPKSSLITISIISLVREQLTIMQQSFIDALAQQQAALEAQHQQLIEALRKELCNVQAFILETPTPPINEINITISKPGPLNANSKPVIVTQPISITNLIPTTKSKKLPNPPMFNGN